MEYARQIEQDRRAYLGDIFLRLDAAVEPVHYALDSFLERLFASTLPADWRQQWRAFAAEEHAPGVWIEPQSVEDLEEWIAAWAAFCGLLPESEAQSNPTVFSIADGQFLGEPDNAPELFALPQYIWITAEQADGLLPSGVADSPFLVIKSSDHSLFSTEAEELVAEFTGLKRNVGPRQQQIPGSGPGGYRIPEFKIRGPGGSVRIRGTIPEVKASTGKTFGSLSSRSRHQIQDFVDYAFRLRSKATLVKHPQIRAQLAGVYVEVFSDVAPPARGHFANLIKAGVIKWSPIPRPPVATTDTFGGLAATLRKPRAIPRPASTNAGIPSSRSIGIGAVKSVIWGTIASLAEANVANEYYRDCTSALEDLLH